MERCPPPCDCASPAAWGRRWDSGGPRVPGLQPWLSAAAVRGIPTDLVAEAPSGWRSVPCASALAGDAGTCTLWVEPYTADAFWSGLPSSAAADLLRLEGATDAEHDLILKAWATIVDAMDIVRWAVCWVEGRAGAGDCMEAHF